MWLDHVCAQPRARLPPFHLRGCRRLRPSEDDPRRPGPIVVCNEAALRSSTSPSALSRASARQSPCSRDRCEPQDPTTRWSLTTPTCSALPSPGHAGEGLVVPRPRRGAHNKPEGYLGVDQYLGAGVDIVGDVTKGIDLADNSVGVIRAWSTSRAHPRQDRDSTSCTVSWCTGDAVVAHPEHRRPGPSRIRATSRSTTRTASGTSPTVGRASCRRSPASSRSGA